MSRPEYFLGHRHRAHLYPGTGPGQPDDETIMTLFSKYCHVDHVA